MLPACNRGAGMNICSPDPCATPPTGAPVPYVNLALNAQAVPFSPNVSLSGVNALNMGSIIPLTNGDQAGAMSPFMGPGQVTTGNPVVSINLLPATNLMCPATGNNMIAASGAVMVPSVTNVFFTYSVPALPDGGRGADAAKGGPAATPADMDLLSALSRQLGPSREGAPESLLVDDVAYLRVPVFSAGIPARVYDLLRRAGAGARLLVLDLRGCPGGELMSAVELAGDFLPEGTVVATATDADGDETVYRSQQEHPYPVPLILLVDGRTASAAEVLAGSLQAHGRAVVVGERTFGKGVAQQILPGAAGPGAHYATVATVTLPHGRSLQGTGIRPDIESDTRGFSAFGTAPFAPLATAPSSPSAPPLPALRPDPGLCPGKVRRAFATCWPLAWISAIRGSVRVGPGASLGVVWVCGAALACTAAPEPRPAAPPRPPAVVAPAAVVPPAVSAEAEADAAAEAEAADAAPAEPSMPAGPRLTSKGYITFIWRRPKVEKLYIGYVRHGQSVALKSTATVPGGDCSGGFYEIEPRGYVCNDGTVTLNPPERFVAAARATDPADGPYPYGYALSNGSPMYNRIPTKDEQVRFERTFRPAGQWIPLHKSVASHGDLATFDPIPVKDGAPAFLLEGKPADTNRLGLVRQTIPLGSMLSYTKVFEAEGRTWLLSVDQTLVPANRMRPFKPTTFHGTALGGDVKLPLAWMRATEKPKYRKLATGEVVKTEASWAVRTWVGLTGQKVESAGKTYLETTESDGAGGRHHIAERDATVAEAREKMPFGVDAGRKWIHVRISKGTLIAYEGLTPVYATLMSPGKGGVPQAGGDNVANATTPTGTYNITFKDRAATMSPETGENRTFWIQDVPWTQYFNPPFALHAAFWHERFGEPTSAGCVNVAPVDAKWLFGWSDPQVPEGWQGATGAGATSANGPTTAVVIQR